MLKRILVFVTGMVFGVLFTLLATGWGLTGEFTGVSLIEYRYEK
jgi:hypothetical protein